MKNFFYTTLVVIGVVILFYIFLDVKPNGLILTLLGLSIFYLIVMSIKEMLTNKSRENKNEK